MKLSQLSTEGFPSWLYFSRENNQSAGYSPVATFNPTQAVNGNPYAGKLSPSTTLHKKTLVVTAETLSTPYARAMLHHLHLAGFRLLLWQHEGPLLLKPEDSIVFPDSNTFATFPKKGYTTLVDHYNLVYDHVTVLEKETWNDVRFALRANIVDNHGMGGMPWRSNYELFYQHPTTLLSSLGSFCCIPGLFFNSKENPYYMRQYDPAIVNFLVNWRGDRRHMLVGYQKDKPGQLYIHFSPEILANKQAVQAIVSNTTLMDRLPIESLVQLAKTDTTVAENILKKYNHKLKGTDLLQVNESLKTNDLQEADYDKRIDESLGTIRKFRPRLYNFLGVKNPSPVLAKKIYAHYLNGRPHPSAEILENMPEAIAVEMLENFNFGDYEPKEKAYDQLFRLGEKHETVAKKIVESLLNQDEWIEALHQKHQIKLLFQLGQEHRDIASYLLSQPSLATLFSTQERQKLQEASESTIETAKRCLLNLQHDDRSAEEWTKIWIANPNLADYMGKMIQQNSKTSPPFLEKGNTITHANMELKFGEMSYNDDNNFEDDMDDPVIDLSNVQSVFFHSSDINQKTDSASSKDFVESIIRQCPLLSEVYIHIDDKNKLDEQGMVWKNGALAIVVKTVGFEGEKYRISPAKDPQKTMPDLGFVYASGAPSLAEINESPSEEHTTLCYSTPLWGIVNPNHRTEIMQHQLAAMMRMSWQQIYAYQGTQLEPAEFTDKQEITPLNAVPSPRVELALVNIEFLPETSDGGYHVPVLTHKQELSRCTGGKIHVDVLGRWIFYPDANRNIHDCELAIGLPKPDIINFKDEYIHKDNINDPRWDAVLDIDKIRKFFHLTYEENQRENKRCSERVRDLLKQNQESTWLYGVSGTGQHAYLIVNDGNNQYYRVDLGGSSNYSEIYVPVSSELQTKMQTIQRAKAVDKPGGGTAVNKKTNFQHTALSADQPVVIQAKLPVTGSTLAEMLANSRDKKFLFEVPDNVVPSLITWGKQQNETLMVIDHFDQFDFDKKTIKIDADETKSQHAVHYDEDGFLADFFKKALAHPDQHFRLIVLWDHFTSTQRVKLNTLLEGSIQNREIPKNVIITSITQKDINHLKKIDDSFTSRHTCRKISEEMQHVFEQEIQRSTHVPFDIHTTPIDLCGYTDWKAALFGPVKTNDNQMHWQASEYAQTWLDTTKANTPQRLTLLHIPEEHRAEAKAYVERSRTLGYFSYHGFSIPFPPELDVEISSQPFYFDSFSKEFIHVRELFVGESPSESVIWINTHLFEHVLQQKHIDNHSGLYNDLQGAIEQARDKALTVKITTPLSDSQWYALLFEARKHHVALVIELAPGVLTPPSLNISMASHCSSSSENITYLHSHDATSSPLKRRVNSAINNNIALSQTKDLPNVCITNDVSDVDALCKNLGYEGKKNTYVFDSEDFSYQDLFFNETHRMKDGKFESFSCTKSDFLKALESPDNHVILKGEFSEALLAYLHPLLATGRIEQSGQSVSLHGKATLTLIIEKPELTNLSNQNIEQALKETSLSWLPKVDGYLSVVKKTPLPVEVEQTTPLDWKKITKDDLSVDKSDAFLHARKELLRTQLEKHPCVVVVGKTGTGKSRLMDLMHEPREGWIVYHTIEDFLAAKRDKPNTKRLLFLDEYNLQNKHLTFLAPLFGSNHPRLLYKGKIVELDKHDNVVLAGNALDYGSGRVKQKFFERYCDKIKEIQLHDFPPAYIYQKILLPLYEESGERVKNRLSQADFQTECLTLLKNYAPEERGESDTVRKLQEDALKILLKKCRESNPLRATGLFKPEKYVHIPYTEKQINVMQFLRDKLDMRSAQRLGWLPSRGMGLNGVLLSGESGVGKTKAIEEVLHTKDPDDYIKIDANLPLSKQKELLLHGFEEGKILWIDEINSILEEDDHHDDDYLEKWINAISTGKHPITGEYDPERKQCLLLVTTNKPDREGRTLLSPALRARFAEPKEMETFNFREAQNANATLSAKL